MNKANTPHMTTVKEAAKITGLSVYRIRQMVLEGRIVHIRAGKKILINIDKLIDHLNTGDKISADTNTERFGIRKIEQQRKVQ